MRRGVCPSGDALASSSPNWRGAWHGYAAGALQGVQNAQHGQLAPTTDPESCADAEPSHCVGVACDTAARNALGPECCGARPCYRQMMGAQQAPSPSATAGGAPTPGSSTVPAPTGFHVGHQERNSPSLPDDTTRTLAANAAMRRWAATRSVACVDGDRSQRVRLEYKRAGQSGRQRQL